MDGQNKNEDQFDTFIDQLIDSRGQNLTAEDREKWFEYLKGGLIVFINRDLLAALPEEKLAQLDNSLSDGTLTADMANRAVAKANLDVENITKNAAIKFRESYMNGEFDADFAEEIQGLPVTAGTATEA